jgi:hypothetical protein
MKQEKCRYGVIERREDNEIHFIGIEMCGHRNREVSFRKNKENAKNWLIRSQREQLTHKQRDALKKVIRRYDREPDSERDFGTYYGVEYDGMFIGIEEDGYTHT